MTPFGTTKDGRDVQAITLQAHGLRATVLTYGAILQSLYLDGVAHSLTIGSDSLADYEGPMLYHGAVVGPVANRISGGSATVDGISHQFERNTHGKHTLHGGTKGTQTRVWDVVTRGDDHVTLSLDLMDGDSGFPSNRRIEAAFQIEPGPNLTLTITTTTDAPTLANLTNHSYWNLSGKDHMAGHTLQITADTFLPVDEESVPTGEIADVSGTPFDFRASRPLHLGEAPFDNTYCAAPARTDLTPTLVLAGDNVEMTVLTTEPGVHIYDDRPNHAALAIECQSWPDAPDNPHFPSIEIGPDAPLVQTTQWQFRRTS